MMVIVDVIFLYCRKRGWKLMPKPKIDNISGRGVIIFGDVGFCVLWCMSFLCQCRYHLIRRQAASTSCYNKNRHPLGWLREVGVSEIYEVAAKIYSGAADLGVSKGDYSTVQRGLFLPTPDWPTDGATNSKWRKAIISAAYTMISCQLATN